MQAVLQRMGLSEVRGDFLAGNNGAIQLTEENLNTLDQIFKLVTPYYENVPETQTFNVSY